MSAQEDQTRIRLLVCDGDMLNKLEAQLATANKDVSFYEREIAKHQRTLAVLRDWISDAEPRRAQLQLSIARQNEELSLHGRNLPFPPEILGYIFEQLTHEPDPKWEDFTNLRTAFNAERVRCPFNLAALCRQWRQIALATSSII
ncbi:hypothetical protein EXIGLDRAFT_775935 [Exidia glandulosa HHB12029]|uniref:Uncharacterized protein n=1 Tax=Exidia glandulosa HHB12029 TaxID=1314781 RepID=A0A165DPM5_EXIGL|nr:hypothetical protein EXIGLDRAFT_775935 [Exidia glandulosa HHB12029]